MKHFEKGNLDYFEWCYQAFGTIKRTLMFTKRLYPKVLGIQPITTRRWWRMDEYGNAFVG